MSGSATVTGNRAAGAGGGVFNDAFSSLTMNDWSAVGSNSVPVTGVASAVRGGGIFVNFFSLATLNDSASVTANNGGGIGNFHGTAMNDFASVSENIGGGIYDRGGVVMSGSVSVSRNTGIGIFVVDGRSLQINDLATVSENAGSGIYNAGSVTVNGFASVSGNRAASMGGGIVNSYSPFTVLVMNDSASVNGNSAGTKTTAGRGGGIWNAGRLVLNDQALIQGNKAIGPGGEGGGIYHCEDVDFSSLTLNGGTVKNNKPDDIKRAACF